MNAKAVKEMKDFVGRVWEGQLKPNKAEWEKRYAGYVKIIKAPKQGRQKFNTPKPFSLYGSISDAKKKCFKLRFAGQDVATITCEKNKVLLTESSKNKCFGRTTILKDANWNSSEAKEFRRFFREEMCSDKVKGKEHRIENCLLTEFSNRCSEDKSLLYIQPIRLHNRYFQMPVPLRASDHSGIYTDGSSTGHIDILARVGKGKHSRLCVMELKDENKPTEPQRDVMKQALIYATFIAALIRSKTCGDKWWDFFENHKKPNAAKSKKHLDIDVLTVMPEWDKSQGSEPEVFSWDVELEELDCTFHCHTLYFDKDELLAGRVKFDKDSTFLTYMNQQAKTN